MSACFFERTISWRRCLTLEANASWGIRETLGTEYDTVGLGQPEEGGQGKGC